MSSEKIPPHSIYIHKKVICGGGVCKGLWCCWWWWGLRRTPNTSCGLVNETSWLTWVWDLGGCGDMCLSSQPGSPPFWPSLVYHLHLRGGPLHSTYFKSSQNLFSSPLVWSPKQSTGLSTCQGTCPHLPGSGQWPPSAVQLPASHVQPILLGPGSR